MKIVVEKAALDAAMQRARKVAGVKSTIPILGHVLLRAEAGRITLHATDMDLATAETVAAEVTLTEAAADAVALPAVKLAAVAAGAPAGSQIELSLEDGIMMARAGRSRWRLATLPAADYPLTPALLPERESQRWDGRALATALARVRGAVDRDPDRVALSGVAFQAAPAEGEGADSPLVLAATDGRRLHAAETALAWGGKTIIVPPQACQAIESLVKEAGEVAVALDPAGQRLEVGAGAVRLATRLLAAEYPDWRRLFPADDKIQTRLDVDRAALAAALRGLTPFGALDANKHLVVTLRLQEGSVTAMGGGRRGADAAATELDARLTGPGLDVTVNLAWLAELLDSLAGERVVLNLVDGLQPVRIDDPGAPGERRLIAPLAMPAPEI